LGVFQIVTFEELHNVFNIIETSSLDTTTPFQHTIKVKASVI